jgi:RimJ/RimL family protein N-acetyltransferase
MLSGKLVNLRAVEPADYLLLWRWLNDPEVMFFWGRPGNTESLPEVTERELAQSKRGDTRKFIVETKDAEPIGQIDYYDLNWQHRSASVSIMLGERDYWGGGYGTDAMRTLLRYLFEQLRLHRVSLTTHETNTRAIRSYHKNGFVAEGTLREWQFFDSNWVNGVIMSVLEHDFVQLSSPSHPTQGDHP